MNSPIHQALEDFARSVRSKTGTVTPGEPEAQLRTPFDRFIKEAGKALGWNVESTDESRLSNKMGCPDFAIHRDDLLAGYAELKAPHTGADASRFTGHNREQFKRFSGIPNILYTDGNDWALYRNGELIGQIVRLSSDVVTEGAAAVSKDDAAALQTLLHDFLLWEPILPLDRNKNVDLRGFAKIMAPLCLMLRNDVEDALGNPESPLNTLADEWRQLLFPDATNEQFADAYAQTVTFALLLGRSEGADPLTLQSAQNSLSSQHNLLSLALQVLTVESVRKEMEASLNLLTRIIAVVPAAAFIADRDPWLYFYEDFLAVYDPKLRKDIGAYYTPIEVVRAQVRIIDELLVNQFRKQLGFASPDTLILDPAVGTGTYLLGVVEHTLEKIKISQGSGAVPANATSLANRLFGFEKMVGPFAVSELRVNGTLKEKGANPKMTAGIYLTDTLESPYSKPPQLSLFYQPLSDQQRKALEVKSNIPILVCLGNPPYDRHEAAAEHNGHRTGSWVRWGEDGKGTDAILQDFLAPLEIAGQGIRAKNLYNLYVYFWRWALWKVFEQDTSSGGIVSFISASSYLDGDAFLGMREHMRKICDEIWILDLGGEGRGSRKTENVFAIQTPVAIAWAVRTKEENKNKPALVHYSSIDGTQKQKLSKLDEISNLTEIDWEDCPTDWHAPFRPPGEGTYFQWPLLTDLLPWQHSGVQFKRTWPIASDKDTLRRRWSQLLSKQPEEKSIAFKETRDRKIDSGCLPLHGNTEAETPLSDLTIDAEAPNIVRYAYRSFDRQWIFADTRLGDYLRPVLWHTHSDKQIYLSSLLTQVLGKGPAVTASHHVPDLHHFPGGSGKSIIPLFRDTEALEVNIWLDIVDELNLKYTEKIIPVDLFSYIYGILANSNFTLRFYDELETKELRVPITKNLVLFKKVKKYGEKLLWLHTYGECKVPRMKILQIIPNGKAKCVTKISDHPENYPESFSYDSKKRTLFVGDGKFAPVKSAVYEFEVSGLNVVQSWLKYRMKNGAGRKSSPLDDIRPDRWDAQMTTELLNLLWVLEETLKIYPQQEKLLDEILKGECFTIDELPEPLPADHELRKAPKVPKKNQNGTLDGISDTESS